MKDTKGNELKIGDRVTDGFASGEIIELLDDTPNTYDGNVLFMDDRVTQEDIDNNDVLTYICWNSEVTKVS